MVLHTSNSSTLESGGRGWQVCIWPGQLSDLKTLPQNKNSGQRFSWPNKGPWYLPSKLIKMLESMEVYRVAHPKLASPPRHNIGGSHRLQDFRQDIVWTTEGSCMPTWNQTVTPVRGRCVEALGWCSKLCEGWYSYFHCYFHNCNYCNLVILLHLGYPGWFSVSSLYSIFSFFFLLVLFGWYRLTTVH